MRTSYKVADELDFVPMNEFQKDFFLLRQTEWDPYRKQLPKVTQGDLADPNYFDFISFAQYATIGEYCDAHELMTIGWIHTHPTQVLA